MSNTTSPDPPRSTAEPTSPAPAASKSTPGPKGQYASSLSQGNSSRPHSRHGEDTSADARQEGRTAPTTTIPDDPDSDGADLPLPLSASLVLTTLPQDASEALETATREWSSGAGVPEKVTIRFQAIGSAPQLRQKIFKVASKNRFETVVAFLSKKLGTNVGASSTRSPAAPTEASGKGGSSTPSKSPDTAAAAAPSSTKKRGKEDVAATSAGAVAGQREQGQVFCYVNSVFAPALDEGVGALWKCFKTDDALTVAYSMTPAFG